MKLIIPHNLGSRISDLRFAKKLNVGIDTSTGIILRVWQWFHANQTGRIEDTAENRELILDHLKDQSALIVGALVDTGVIHEEKSSEMHLLVLDGYEALQKDIAIQGAHARNASISLKRNHKEAQDLLKYLDSQAITSQHDSDTRRRAYHILISIQQALGRMSVNGRDYTDALITDVLEIIVPDSSEEKLRMVLTWMRANQSRDRRLKQQLGIIIRNWPTFVAAAEKNETYIA